MSWFSKIFARPIAAPAPIAETTRDPESAGSRGKIISTESVVAWCERLEREGQRTGNTRMLAQARNIRNRLAP